MGEHARSLRIHTRSLARLLDYSPRPRVAVEKVRSRLPFQPEGVLEVEDDDLVGVLLDELEPQSGNSDRLSHPLHPILGIVRISLLGLLNCLFLQRLQNSIR